MTMQLSVSEASAYLAPFLARSEDLRYERAGGGVDHLCGTWKPTMRDAVNIDRFERAVNALSPWLTATVSHDRQYDAVNDVFVRGAPEVVWTTSDPMLIHDIIEQSSRALDRFDWNDEDAHEREKRRIKKREHQDAERVRKARQDAYREEALF